MAKTQSKGRAKTKLINLRVSPLLHARLQIAAKLDMVPFPVHLRRILERSTKAAESLQETR